MLYYVRRYILIRNFKPLHIIHFLIFFHENWYKYVLFHAEFIFIHHFEKYSIVQKIMGKIQCLTTVAMETHFLAGSNCVTTCFPQFLNSATIKYLICKFSCLYPEVHTIFSKPLQYYAFCILLPLEFAHITVFSYFLLSSVLNLIDLIVQLTLRTTVFSRLFFRVHFILVHFTKEKIKKIFRVKIVELKERSRNTYKSILLRNRRIATFKTRVKKQVYIK